MTESSWPKIYSTTIGERLKMPPAELEALWQEYREYWYGDIHYHQNTDREAAALQHEYQADWLEDREGRHR